MVKVPCPVTVELEPTQTSLVIGCPGVPRSVPRIETKLLIRSINGQPFTLRSVGIELRTTQRVSIPSTLGSNESTQEYKLYEDPFVFNPTFGNFTAENLIGLDLPVLISLPKDIISSGYNLNWNASTVHNLIVRVMVGESAETETGFMESFPIAVKLYDALPIYRQFTESINESVISGDQQLIVEYKLQESCLGPGDSLNLAVKIMKNSLNYNVSSKLRVKTLNFQLKEVLECHEGGLPPYKDITIIEDLKDGKELNLNNEISLNYGFKLPTNSDFLSIFDKNESSLQKYTYFDSYQDNVPVHIDNHMNHKQNQVKLIEGIPMTHYQNFTTVGKLFSIRYEILLKLKLVHGKDFTVRIPIVLSPYNKTSSEYLLNWIINQCKISSEIFGKTLINQLAQSYNTKDSTSSLSRFKAPLQIYKSNRNDWVKLGFSFDSFGTPQPIGSYID
ncbi:hypothetical protein PSN45_002330 [Yamadazyma tenuis]|uniref:Arrestin C-terminal-like domain-containing protein n=1 Tax=Candida tenuis (strain ATCC 10573 / BCRC 21748 / CBS 615 / JCM 9827 / NBRC 10315 / NRRL Y-1498 / VKM Y-70) TaxID=590646 RepID=G3BEP8_CANTC|nr:uncharacterized protein CANTEDRAFT_99508 [Yamadazyma tenuis ATCC 10573]EGV59945.1 hypothetical protein CANTEDRAFT_99508 [Yamadazyma tenuis ATCC 10573]WEJ94830.1 hypothetical protein PSN45_002330 [Yamadazyma tenuis]